MWMPPPRCTFQSQHVVVQMTPSFEASGAHSKWFVLASVVSPASDADWPSAPPSLHSPTSVCSLLLFSHSPARASFEKRKTHLFLSQNSLKFEKQQISAISTHPDLQQRNAHNTNREEKKFWLEHKNQNTKSQKRCSNTAIQNKKPNTVWRPVNAMVRQYANSCASPGAMSSSSNSSSSSSSDLNAIERLMTQLMHEPTCHQFALGPIGTPQKRHESFSSSNASTPASSTKKSQQRAKHHNKSKNNQRPRLDSTSSLNKTPGTY